MGVIVFIILQIFFPTQALGNLKFGGIPPRGCWMSRTFHKLLGNTLATSRVSRNFFRFEHFSTFWATFSCYQSWEIGATFSALGPCYHFLWKQEPDLPIPLGQMMVQAACSQAATFDWRKGRIFTRLSLVIHFWVLIKDKVISQRWLRHKNV